MSGCKKIIYISRQFVVKKLKVRDELRKFDRINFKVYAVGKLRKAVQAPGYSILIGMQRIGGCSTGRL